MLYLDQLYIRGGLSDSYLMQEFAEEDTEIHLNRCTGHINRLLRIILSEGSHCEYLKLESMSQSLNWQSLGVALAAYPKLVRLDIDQIELSLHSMAALSAGLQHLRQLYLTKMQWDAADDEALAMALSRSQSLQCLNLSGCGLDDDRVARLVRSVHSSLERLHLSGNKLGRETSVALADLLQESSSRLCELHLDQSRYAHRRGPHRARLNFHVIAEAVRHNNKLRVLDLSDNLVEDDDLEVLARSMMTMFSDDHGELHQNNTHNSTLETLILTRNRITDAGLSRLLYQWLPQIRCLKTLTLEGNLMEDIAPPTTATTPSILRNRAIKAVLDLEDVALIKAVALPEQISVGLWPLLLKRLQEIHKNKERTFTAATATTALADILYPVVRGPMVLPICR